MQSVFVFSLKKNLFAIDSCHVQEILFCMNVLHDPNINSPYFATTSLNGEQIPLINIDKTLSINNNKSKHPWNIIVLKLYIDGYYRRLGILVENAEGTLVFEKEELLLTPELYYNNSCCHLIKGVIIIDSNKVFILDINKIKDVIKHKPLPVIKDEKLFMDWAPQ